MNGGTWPISHMQQPEPIFDWLPAETGAAGPVIFASPHSGRHYPDSFRRQSRLEPLDLRRGEDCYVDELIAEVPHLGAPVLAARYGRAYVDLNRDPEELDPLLFDPAPPPTPASLSERVGAGLGVIPRIVATSMPIYGGRMPLSEGLARLEQVHVPYHDRLSAVLEAARRDYGWAVLIDCHSMPAMPVRDTPAPAQIILGDRYGGACTPMVIDRMEQAFLDEGFSVARNCPYAGGYCTARYGRPQDGLHAIQVEIARSLYMDEATLARHNGFAPLRRTLTRIFETFLHGVRPGLPLAAE